MNVSEIDELAEGAKESRTQMDARMFELKSRVVTILDRDLYVHINQECSLSQAHEIVVNSSAWAEKRRTSATSGRNV